MKKYRLCITLSVILLTIVNIPTNARQQPMRLWYNRPAAFFEESLPIGNGKIGALLYGGADTDSLYLNDITLWTGQPVDRNEDAGASQWIPKIREALFNEDYALADSLQLHVQGHNSQFYQPLGMLYIDDRNAGSVGSYYRTLSLDSAVAYASNLKYWAFSKSSAFSRAFASVIFSTSVKTSSSLIFSCGKE